MLKDIRYAEQILFILVFSVIIYGAFYNSEDSVRNYKRGIQAGAFVLVAEGTLVHYKGPFLRPNPAFWRGIARFCLLYMVALVFIVYQTPKDAREMMSHLYPELGKPVPHSMHTYDDNCEFELINLWDNLDHYFAIHVINWFFAALIVRDAYILNFWSILDELIELSWQHILPHFRECWWDHALLDVLLSNTPSIFLGLWVARKLGLQEYDWLGRKGKKSFKDWDVFQCHRRFGGLSSILFLICSNFLTGFFLINNLWIPPQNYLNLYRLLVWFLLGGLAFRECYTDIITWGKQERKENPISGKMRWLCCSVIFLEVLVSWKLRHGAGNMVMDAGWPLYIAIPWILSICIFFLTYIYLRFKKNRTTIYGNFPDNSIENKKSK